MFALRLWIAAAIVGALAFSHFSAFRAGKNHVRLEWKAATADANAESRRLEQQRQRRADEAGQLAAKRSSALAADARAANYQLSGVRDELDETRRYAAQSHDAAAKSIATLSAVFESCTRANIELATAAQGHANDSLMYQESWPK